MFTECLILKMSSIRGRLLRHTIPFLHSLCQNHLHAKLQVSGCLIDLLLLALSRLSQLIGCFQKLLCISVSVLTHTETQS